MLLLAQPWRGGFKQESAMRRGLVCLLLVLCFASQGQSLLCEICQDFCSCIKPEVVTCPAHNRCYETHDRHGRIVKKGCTKNCLYESNKCKQCSWDYCNRTPNPEIRYQKEDPCSPDNENKTNVVDKKTSRHVGLSLILGYILWML
ncbi:hypothetical protein L596_025378 [Steinernema carpocapsae]|uniref:Uncharacterized protein n=1 Tax=Steinernema carpocapsae TaxID=34508 RepID=A0A4U5M8G0_STECR|nr:hypothetical protein L596_025378 [Steinernema carpocapsae]